MLTTITGMYDQGKITFLEEPPVKSKAKVMITFLTDEKTETTPMAEKRILGSLAGKIKVPDDFDEPLEDLKDYMY